MTEYGTTPQGFIRKPLAVILAELQEAMIAQFGPQIIQTSQSPLGQLNAVFADASVEHWETIAAVYQALDVDQAEGRKLDIAAKLRRMSRLPDESDFAFRLRITNEAQADIKLIANIQRLRDLPGVTWANAHENATSTVNALGMPPHSVAYAVIGGADVDVGWLVYQMSVPGIELFGNYLTEIVADGYCQTSIFIRPVDVPITVEVQVRHIPDATGCAPVRTSTLADNLVDYFQGSTNGFRNGDTVTKDQIEAAVARNGNLKVVDVKIARRADATVLDEIETSIFERPVILEPYVTIRYVD